jgi:pyruvate,orthophosphate dikinase
VSRGAASLILEEDPFTAFDQQGVGKLVELAVKGARAVSPETSIRVAGGHTKDPGLVEFAVGNAGVDGVSTSSREVPVAKLISVKEERSSHG